MPRKIVGGGGGSLLSANTQRQSGDILIRKGSVFFGESALERKQTGSYYTPESLVRFLNEKTIVQPLREKFKQNYRRRFDELLEVARIGYDSGERCGAARSATAIIECFADQEVLSFKVCDPAMGSGHFLVDAANQMAGLVVELLEEIPDINNLCVSATSQPNYWRRLVTRHCLYGVDLNPLAVDLAKLSLWLNCFAKKHKLTFIDHHLRQGNSLIGLQSLQKLKTIPDRKSTGSKVKSRQALLFDFNDMSQSFEDVAKGFASITEMKEDDTDAQKSKLEEIDKDIEQFNPLANLFTGYLMDGDMTPADYREIFQCLVDGRAVRSGLPANLTEKWVRLQSYHKRHKFFHWPLEFPDVFGKRAGTGFSATVGNPPWDAVKTNSQEFFSYYDSDFRKYTKQKANTVAEELMESNPQIKQNWEHYCERYKQLSNYYREPAAFKAIGKSEINTYRLFLEIYFTLVRKGGRMGIVVPSGVYTDQGCMPIRQLYFDEGSIDFIYSFENRKGIFNIHRMFKFVLLGVEKGANIDTFKCEFMVHDPEKLPMYEKSALQMSESQVRRFSPNSLSIMEFDSQKEIEIAECIYSRNPFLGDYLRNYWDTGFQREFEITEHSHLFLSSEQVNNVNLLPLWRGRQIWILTNEFSNPTDWMERSYAETKATTQRVRFVYRRLAGSSNERTFIPTVIPAAIPTGSSIVVSPLPEQAAVIVAAIAGSFIFDWVIRGKVNTAVSKFFVEQLPIVDFERRDTRTQEIRVSVLARACRLICTSEIFSEIWNSCFQEDWTRPEFWYSNISSLNYGPAHEWDIRHNIIEHTKVLQKNWSVECGARDRLPDARDTGDRAQLRAEIDAYVAHLYGINREQFAYILDDFPVLRKKEEKAFGEFTSRRKCLEEFDRLAPILGEKL